MRVRVDPGSAAGDLAPGRGSLLRAFGGWGPRPAAPEPQPRPERRAEPRHQHVECLARVGWRTWRGFAMNDAVLIDLSRGGARVFLDAPPPRGRVRMRTRAVWLFLETPGSKAVVKARVLDLRPTAQGQYVVRVGFDEPCPYALFEAAVCGLAPADPKARLAPAPRPGRAVAARG
jgi:hypothetical protein